MVVAAAVGTLCRHAAQASDAGERRASGRDDERGHSARAVVARRVRTAAPARRRRAAAEGAASAKTPPSQRAPARALRRCGRGVRAERGERADHARAAGGCRPTDPALCEPGCHRAGAAVARACGDPAAAGCADLAGPARFPPRDAHGIGLCPAGAVPQRQRTRRRRRRHEGRARHAPRLCRDRALRRRRDEPCGPDRPRQRG